jgi:molecular chaperone GrpE (heat shock protein)
MKIRNRIANTWAGLLGRPSAEAQELRKEILSIRRELAAVRLELEDSRQALALHRRRIQEMESESRHQDDDATEALFEDLVSTVSQLRMQDALMESGREISGGSIMALARQVVAALEKAGLEPVGVFGREIPFDPQTCEPLASDAVFVPGETVVIRFIGYQYRNRILRKALVERMN